VQAAFAEPPKLHRFVNQVSGWVADAASIVMDTYGGDASAIWFDKPSAAVLRARFDAFPGVAQKKAAMAVEILERALHVAVAELSGSDVAYDVHLRRVFLRTGLAEHDDVDHMVAVARALHPERPGELDNPVWDIGRSWCHRRNPDCHTCPLVAVCSRLIERGDRVGGI
jgi:endonuclease III